MKICSGGEIYKDTSFTNLEGSQFKNILELRLEQLREKNDKLDRSTEKTQVLRGRIAEVKLLLKDLDVVHVDN